MKKSIAVFVGMFLMVGGVAVNASAARTKCTISAVKDHAVIMDCGENTGKLKVGSVVTVKVKKKAIEGC